MQTNSKISRMNCGVIYAIKQNREGDYAKSVIQFMSKYTDTPIEYYSDKAVESIVINAVAEMMEKMEHSSVYFCSYMRWQDYPWNMSCFEALCAALSEVMVYDTKNKKYVNGFRPLEEYDEFKSVKEN